VTLQSRKKRAEIAQGLSVVVDALQFGFRPDLERKQRKRAAKPRLLTAYDLETSRIEPGTPRPLYITAFAEKRMHYASPIADLEHLHAILVQHFLTEENLGTSFVAWNGNRFDAYFIAAALITDPRFVMRPYMTRSKALRGMRVMRAEDAGDEHAPGWEFLDGIAMLGLVGVSLAKLLATFAPDYQKMVGAVDFENEEFDHRNPLHCEYAMRDSVGLYYAMSRAQQILLDNFDQALGVTMGGACIKIFSANIPQGVTVESMIPNARTVVHDYVMRGGYCYCAARYFGPVWKYDLNQAYAAAMREASLPCGGMLHGKGWPNPKAPAYIARVTAEKPGNAIPFYYRTETGGRLRSAMTTERIEETWLTSIEVRQLVSEGWNIECFEHWQWASSFQMREYVDGLERLRTTCEGGPSGPIGTMVKAVGNHSYGKTVEQIEPMTFVLAAEQPLDFLPFYGDNDDPIEHIYYAFDLDRRAKAHHQPQLGAFITAHVRMVLRRAALVAPDAFLYADTDCAIFSRDVTASLDIDPKRYGAWKVEESGTVYRIIAKKVYQEVKPAGGGKRSAKGLNVKRLSDDDFAQWFDGNEPVQDQVQIQNFLSVIAGATKNTRQLKNAEMYRRQRRKGTHVPTA